MNQGNDFWQLSFGNLLTLVALLLSFWGAHLSNKKRIESDAATFQEIKTKVDLIYGWFRDNVIGRKAHQEGD